MRYLTLNHLSLFTLLSSSFPTSDVDDIFLAIEIEDEDSCIIHLLT